ncbi:hypothetical protein M0657_003785 [Pyricularia oryzae]|uniref:Uncharacterized protein n=1 Tax=Pyricularia oryzae TaxID=318829 RepID=A0A4P7NBB4_PYROR|nr:hypothetical protein M9X92_004831 [Pyricularia oryzae]KAI7926324.1 hypothetical protein M0657_003785 [Pyricularia oryzae]QBZ59042.1 hypothetical protein PoMZ_04002 [Pyricularia oryzae]
MAMSNCDARDLSKALGLPTLRRNLSATDCTCGTSGTKFAYDFFGDNSQGFEVSAGRGVEAGTSSGGTHTTRLFR